MRDFDHPDYYRFPRRLPAGSSLRVHVRPNWSAIGVLVALAIFWGVVSFLFLK